jgi:hypothetical protein
MIIKEAKSLKAFKLELDDLIKHCAAVTTSPPDLLEHIAREAHHLWRNLEKGLYPNINGQGKYETSETKGMASVLPKVLIIVKDEGYNHYFQ